MHETPATEPWCCGRSRPELPWTARGAPLRRGGGGSGAQRWRVRCRRPRCACPAGPATRPGPRIARRTARRGRGGRALGDDAGPGPAGAVGGREAGVHGRPMGCRQRGFQTPLPCIGAGGRVWRPSICSGPRAVSTGRWVLSRRSATTPAVAPCHVGTRPRPPGGRCIRSWPRLPDRSDAALPCHVQPRCPRRLPKNQALTA